MSKRLQVLLPDEELTEIQRFARREARLRQPVDDAFAIEKADVVRRWPGMTRLHSV